jgi:hypothetical protein
MFLHRLLRGRRRLFNHECFSVIRSRGDERSQFTEGTGRVFIKLMRRDHVYIQWRHNLALLPYLNGICSRRWLRGSQVCPANESKRSADYCCTYGMRYGCLFFQEEWFIVVHTLRNLKSWLGNGANNRESTI